MTAFWDIAPSCLIQVDERFRGAYCHHEHEDSWLAVLLHVVDVLASNLSTDAIYAVFRSLWCLLGPSRQVPTQCFKSGRDCFFPLTFQLLIP